MRSTRACVRAFVCPSRLRARALSQWTRPGAGLTASSAHCSEHSLRAMQPLCRRANTEHFDNAPIHTQLLAAAAAGHSNQSAESARLATRNYHCSTPLAHAKCRATSGVSVQQHLRDCSHTHVKRYRLHCQFKRKTQSIQMSA